MKKYEDIFRPGWNNFQRNNPTKIIGSGLKYEFVSILTNHAEDLMYPYKEQDGIPEKFWLTTKGGKIFLDRLINSQLYLQFYCN